LASQSHRVKVRRGINTVVFLVKSSCISVVDRDLSGVFAFEAAVLVIDVTMEFAVIFMFLFLANCFGFKNISFFADIAFL
jgi:hypothetical protein